MNIRTSRLGAFASILALGACSRTPSPTPEAHASRRDAVVGVIPMSLREGFKRTERIPTKNICVDRGRAVQKVGKISAFAFEHREEAEFERKFKVAGELGFKVSKDAMRAS